MLKVKFLGKSLIKNVSMCIAQAHRDTTMDKKLISHCAFKIREEGDILRFITLVPKVLQQSFLTRWLNNFKYFY